MPIGLLFWVLFVIWVVFGWVNDLPIWGPYGRRGYHLLILILLFLLGWHAFGFVIHA